MSLKTVVNKGGVETETISANYLSCLYKIVFCFVNAESQAMSFPGDLLLQCASPNSKKRMMWREVMGWLLDHLGLSWGQGEKGGDTKEN